MATVQNFISLLIKYINYHDNQAELVTKMEIKEFIEGSINFQQFVVTIEKYSGSLKYLCKEIQHLHDYAGRVISYNIDLTAESLKDLKKSLKNAIAPEKFEKSNDESVLTVTGNNIVMSEIMGQVESDPGFLNGELCGVKIFARSVLYVDMGLSKEKWHGKNFVVLTDVLNVTTENIVWNFSGNDRLDEFSENAGTDNEGNGLDGKDGNPGEYIIYW